MDCSPLGYSVHGIFQANTGLSYPSSEDLPHPGIEHVSPTGGFFTTELPGKPNYQRQAWLIQHEGKKTHTENVLAHVDFWQC